MPKVDLEDGKAAYKEAVRVAPDRYERKVKKADWKTPASSDAAEKAYQDALKEAMDKKRRQKAISKLSNDVWQTGAINYGKKRLEEGMKDKEEKWATNFKPYADAISTVTLPDRTADWKDNLKRVEKIVEALKNKKAEIKG
jgi:hypothetical protein